MAPPSSSVPSNNDGHITAAKDKTKPRITPHNIPSGPIIEKKTKPKKLPIIRKVQKNIYYGSKLIFEKLEELPPSCSVFPQFLQTWLPEKDSSIMKVSLQ